MSLPNSTEVTFMGQEWPGQGRYTLTASYGDGQYCTAGDVPQKKPHATSGGHAHMHISAGQALQQLNATHIASG